MMFKVSARNELGVVAKLNPRGDVWVVIVLERERG